MPSDNEMKKQSKDLITQINSRESRTERAAKNYPQDTPRGREIEDLTRQKLARELHDGLSQTVSALAMRINFARRMMMSEPDEAEKELAKVEDLVRKTTREIKHMIFLLRPLEIESQGLPVALESLAKKMKELFNLEIKLDINSELVELLPPGDQRVIYSIAEEAIDSARRRNRAAYLLVRLDEMNQQTIKLEIVDMGKPADREEFPSQGLESIQKFAALIDGSVKLEQDGYLVKVLFPYPDILEKGESALG